ncbi:MAG TPA: condensation domain-containing protein, partial [Pyrinomonadaceae bacterium]|nr:condensation domain-containing protein [Pyrinomonadaceae bacterium]
MRSAMQQLVNRHDALRATIDPDARQQVIASSMTISVPLLDFSKKDDAETFIAEWQLEEARKPFDFVRGPLFRANVLRVSQQYHVLVLTIHHLVIDGWSFGVLLRELTKLYEAECRRVPPSLPPAKQFSEYVQWQSQQQQGPEMDRAEAYWLDQYSDSVPVLEPPSDRPRPAVQTYNGRRERLTIDASLCSAIKHVSARERATLFMTLLASYNVLLHRLTNQDDVVVGIASAGQASVTGDDLIGYCINLLPLRSRISDDPSFSEYLARSKRVLSDAFDHQVYPLPNLIKKLGLARDPSRPPLVSVTFNLDRGGNRMQFFDLEAEVIPVSANSAKFDLFLNVTDQDGELFLDMDYNSDLFDAATIHRWLGHMRALLAGVVADPRRRLSELPLLDEHEQEQVLVQWNQTHAEFPNRSLSELFEAQAESTPDQIAVAFENEKLTYRELNQRANQLAHYLKAQGVETETLVGVLLNRSIDLIVALVGILKAGGAYVPLDPSYPAERLSFMLADTGAPLLLTNERLADLVSTTATKVIRLDVEAEQISVESNENPSTVASAGYLAYVIYTSGSTGTPKGISIPQSAVNRLVFNTKYIDLQPSDVVAQLSNFSFDAFTFEIWGALLHGAQLRILANDITLSPVEFGGEIGARGITTMFLTTALFNVIAREAPWTFSTLKHLLTGGEMADPESFRK